MKAPFLVATAGLLLFVAAGVIAVSAMDSRSAQAMAPCGDHTNTAEELQFLSMLQDWRDNTLPVSPSLVISAPLNAAAAGYAQFLADTHGASGHTADGATPQQRAIQCGYPESIAAGGHGVAVFTASTAGSATPQAALTQMIQHQGRGIYIPEHNAKCVGVAKATGSGGSRAAWIVMIFFAFGDCPQTVAGIPATPTATPTATATPSPTATATPSPTPTPTPEPTPPGVELVVPMVARD